MINRYTYAPIGRTPHMEPMGAGEWVKWDDHASHIAAANQRHAAAIEAVATARADGCAEGLRRALDCAILAITGDADGRDIYNDIKALVDASPAEPAPAMKNRRAYQIGLIVGKAARQAEIDQASPAEHCGYCDGTGDVHRADGEWMGSCDCGAKP